MSPSTLEPVHPEALSDPKQEALYMLGLRRYRQAKYADARSVFEVLIGCAPFERSYHMALAAATQMLGRHEEAMLSYSTAIMMDMTDPVPQFHLAECMIALHRARDAVEVLEFAHCQSDSALHRALRTRIEGLLQLLKAEPSA